MSAARAQTRMEREAEESAAVAERQAAENAALLKQIGRALRDLDPRLVMTCARGSSDHAATYAKHLIELETGIPAASHSPSISSIYRAKWRGLERTLFLAISQSGESPDLVLSARAAREAGAMVVSIVNAHSSPLAAESDWVLPIAAGAEKSVAATKSFIGSMLAVAGLVAEWSDSDPLRAALSSAPDALRRSWALNWSTDVGSLRSARNMYVIGRGSTLPIAQEAALKLKETCGIHAEAVSAAEVQHGPMAIVGRDFPVLLLAPDDAAGPYVAPLAERLVKQGAHVIAAGLKVEGALNLPVVSGLHPAIAPAASILSAYRMIAALSLARGLDPDAPPNLRKVTETR